MMFCPREVVICLLGRFLCIWECEFSLQSMECSFMIFSNSDIFRCLNSDFLYFLRSIVSVSILFLEGSSNMLAWKKTVTFLFSGGRFL